MKRTLLALFVFFLVGSVLGQAPQPAKIRTTTWNLEWGMGSYLNIQHFKRAFQLPVSFGTLLNPTNLLTDRGVIYSAGPRTDFAQSQATVLPGKPDCHLSSLGPVDRFSRKSV